MGSGGISAEFKYSNQKEEEMANDLSTYVSSQSIISVGSKPPVSLNAVEWANQASENPMPVNIILEPIYDLLTRKNFPADGAIETKQKFSIRKW